jgi:hypothetical protein
MATKYSPKIITNGLVLSLDAANNKSYPRSGTTWTDLSGNNNTGTLTNGPTFSSANGGSIVFDGTNDYISLGTSTLYLPSVSHALEIWVKSPSLGSGMNAGGLISITYGIIMQINGGNLYYSVYNSDTSAYIISAATTGLNLHDNIWHHIVCTKGTSTFEMYVDGVVKQTGSFSGVWSGTNIWSEMSATVGSNPNDVYYYLKGSVGLAKIYKRYLNASEVLQNYNATKGRFGL